MKLGAFDLKEPIGEGGMGSVWRGNHPEADVEVAIKVMRPEVMNDPDYREAFDTEVRSVASLHHPHIVTILDFGQVPSGVAEAAGEKIEGGSPYLVMEYAQGGSVEDYFAQIRWPDLRELLLVTLDALAHAHARDVIHRDLKPENILVGCGPKWDVKLTDFGLAHAADRFRDSGKVETAWGTPQYMAPEQLRGLWREYGPWTDLYGLGCMAFELITGQFVFDGDTVVELGQAHIEEPIPALRPRFEVPEGTEDWIRKMLAKNRCDRFCHAADAAHELARLPYLDDRDGFGVLFERPDDSSEETRQLYDGPTTQLLPDVATTNQGIAELDDVDTAAVSGGLSDLDGPVDLPPLPHDWRQRRDGVISNQLLGISLGLFGLRAIPLVDRDEERDWLWEMLHRVHRTERAGLCVIEGATGTGKSQLVQWLCYRARELGGARVLTAYHSPVLGPADGLVAMLERYLRCTKLEGDARRSHLADMLMGERLVGAFELQTLLALFDDSTSDVASGSRRPHQSGRQERYAILYRFLSLLAERRPVLLWLDDVQWGWDALGFARYIEKRQSSSPAPIMVAMTARSDALEERATEYRLLQSLKTCSGVEAIEVEPLRRRDTETLVRRLLRLDEELAEHLLRRSEGVPLFAVQLVEDWVSRGKLVMGDDGFELRPGVSVAIPDDIYQLWDERLQGFVDAVGRDALSALEVAAALGQEIDGGEWRLAVERAGLSDVSGLVDRLVDEDLAQTMEGGWKFAHGLLRESVERGAREADRWSRWNAFCAQAVNELHSIDETGVPERLARYWRRAGQLKQALEALGAAVDEAIERSDYDHASDLIDWREAMTSDDALRWVLETEIDRARIAERRGDYRQCAEIADAAASQAREAGHRELAARAAIWAGIGRRALGELDVAESALQAVCSYFGRGDRRAESKKHLAKASLELGRIEEMRGDFELARRHFERGRDVFVELGDGYGEALCLNGLGDVLRRSGDFDDAHRACLQALERFRDVDNITGIADCLDDLAEAARFQGQLDEAREFAEEALRLYRALDSKHQQVVRLNLAMISLAEQKFDNAARLFEQLIEVFDKDGRRAPLVEARAGLLAAEAGRERWNLYSDRLVSVETALRDTEIRTPGVNWALDIARRLAVDAGKQKLADATEQLATAQIRGIRRTLSIEEPLE